MFNDAKKPKTQYSILMDQRCAKGLPCMQQLLSLENKSNIYYSNAGTNVLMSSPHVTKVLAALPYIHESLNIV